MPEEQREDSFFVNYAAVVRKRKRFIAGFVVFALAVAFITLALNPRTYRSQVTLTVLPVNAYYPKLNNQIESADLSIIRDTHRMLLGSKSVLAMLLDQLKATGLITAAASQELLTKNLVVSLDKETKMIVLEAWDTNPERAQAIVNSWAQCYVAYHQEKSAIGLEKHAFIYKQRLLNDYADEITELEFTLPIRERFLKDLLEKTNVLKAAPDALTTITEAQKELDTIEARVAYLKNKREQLYQEIGFSQTYLEQKTPKAGTPVFSPDALPQPYAPTSENGLSPTDVLMIPLDEAGLGEIKIITSASAAEPTTPSKIITLSSVGMVSFLLAAFLASIMEIAFGDQKKTAA